VQYGEHCRSERTKASCEVEILQGNSFLLNTSCRIVNSDNRTSLGQQSSEVRKMRDLPNLSLRFKRLAAGTLERTSAHRLDGFTESRLNHIAREGLKHLVRLDISNVAIPVQVLMPGRASICFSPKHFSLIILVDPVITNVGKCPMRSPVNSSADLASHSTPSSHRSWLPILAWSEEPLPVRVFGQRPVIP